MGVDFQLLRLWVYGLKRNSIVTTPKRIIPLGGNHSRILRSTDAPTNGNVQTPSAANRRRRPDPNFTRATASMPPQANREQGVEILGIHSTRHVNPPLIAARLANLPVSPALPRSPHVHVGCEESRASIVGWIQPQHRLKHPGARRQNRPAADAALSGKKTPQLALTRSECEERRDRNTNSHGPIGGRDSRNYWRPRLTGGKGSCSPC
jgi:hypothetical protein